LESEFQEEVLQLEKKYFAKFTPLYEKRSEIINGKVEPTDEEVKREQMPPRPLRRPNSPMSWLRPSREFPSSGCLP
jgi:hypothetical protein